MCGETWRQHSTYNYQSVYCCTGILLEHTRTMYYPVWTYNRFKFALSIFFVRDASASRYCFPGISMIYYDNTLVIFRLREKYVMVCNVNYFLRCTFLTVVRVYSAEKQIYWITAHSQCNLCVRKLQTRNTLVCASEREQIVVKTCKRLSVLFNKQVSNINEVTE